MVVYTITEEVTTFEGGTRLDTRTVDYAVCRSKESAIEKSKELLVKHAAFADGWSIKEIDYEKGLLKCYYENELCVMLEYTNYELEVLD